MNIIRRKYPILYVKACKDYEMEYIVTAYNNPRDMDPFYLIDKKTGAV